MEARMLRTGICDLLQVEHPIAIGGMGSVYSPALIAFVSSAGSFGAIDAGANHIRRRREKAADQQAVRDKFSSLRHLRSGLRSGAGSASGCACFAWPRSEQDIKTYVDRAHGIGAKVTFMAGGAPEATRAAEAGVDVIIAQGTAG